MAFTRISTLLALSLSLLFLSAPLVHGQSSTTTTSPTAAPVLYPGDSSYEYYGCYNETTEIPGTGGARALAPADGQQVMRTDMTPEICINLCKAKGTNFAGLEYSRECFCAVYINGISAKLPDSECALPCDGDKGLICGGSLKLTIYQKIKAKKGTGSNLARDAPVGSILALGIAMGTLLLLA